MMESDYSHKLCMKLKALAAKWGEEYGKKDEVVIVEIPISSSVPRDLAFVWQWGDPLPVPQWYFEVHYGERGARTKVADLDEVSLEELEEIIPAHLDTLYEKIKNNHETDAQTSERYEGLLATVKGMLDD